MELFKHRVTVPQIVCSVLTSHLYSYNQEQEHEKHYDIRKGRRWRSSLIRNPSTVGHTGLSHQQLDNHVKCSNTLEWITLLVKRGGFIFWHSSRVSQVWVSAYDCPRLWWFFFIALLFIFHVTSICCMHQLHAKIPVPVRCLSSCLWLTKITSYLISALQGFILVDVTCFEQYLYHIDSLTNVKSPTVEW